MKRIWRGGCILKINYENKVKNEQSEKQETIIDCQKITIRIKS